MRTHEARKSIGSHQYNRIGQYQIYPPQGCPDIFPQRCPPCPPCPECPTCPPVGVLQTEVFQFTAFADGIRNVFTNQDAAPQFSTIGILDPQNVSITNLFINGILQPPNLYTVQPGSLVLSDVPFRGVPIILQFVVIRQS